MSDPKHIETLLTQLAAHVKSVVEPVAARCAELEKRLAEAHAAIAELRAAPAPEPIPAPEPQIITLSLETEAVQQIVSDMRVALEQDGEARVKVIEDAAQDALTRMAHAGREFEQSLPQTVERAVPDLVRDAIERAVEPLRTEADAAKAVVSEAVGGMQEHTEQALVRLRTEIERAVEPFEGELRSLVQAAAAASEQVTKEAADFQAERTAVLEALRAEAARSIGEAGETVKRAADALPAQVDEAAKALDARLAQAETAISAGVPQIIERVMAEMLPEAVTRSVDTAVSAITLPEPVPGRDALALEVAPEIDVAKSYARGTYATHNGGLWRAYESTKGMRGWECIVRGVAGVKFDFEGEREVVATVQMSDGTASEFRKAFPVVIDRGVWAEGKTFEPGDGVSYRGNYFIAGNEASGRPGLPDSKGWRLAVRAGRDAKTVYRTVDTSPPKPVATRPAAGEASQ